MICVHAVDLATPGSYLILRNTKVDMFRGSMRLVTTQWGKAELADDATANKVKVSVVLCSLPVLHPHNPIKEHCGCAGGRQHVSGGI